MVQHNNGADKQPKRTRFVHFSGGPVIIMGLTPGRHKLLIELVNANHQATDRGTVQVTIPLAKLHPEAH